MNVYVLATKNYILYKLRSSTRIFSPDKSRTLTSVKLRYFHCGDVDGVMFNMMFDPMTALKFAGCNLYLSIKKSSQKRISKNIRKRSRNLGTTLGESSEVFRKLPKTFCNDEAEVDAK